MNIRLFSSGLPNSWQMPSLCVPRMINIARSKIQASRFEGRCGGCFLFPDEEFVRLASWNCYGFPDLKGLDFQGSFRHVRRCVHG